ncbi:hypothetical protein SAY86_016653 [Trapa natans]|uniref:SWI/SNF complex subunit SWI3A n=1 Tax=Trapa natans TaxID=22666 RepID=A0AAN7QZP0_TRANT|nr:hypothetical protein SAY86_016653 [Trapa natans]
MASTTTASLDPLSRSSRPEGSELDDLYTIPIRSSWFSWGEIHETERVALREFFDLSSISRTPKIYKEYRDFIINKYREDPLRRLTFTEVRKSLVGDVSLLHKVFLFLEKWGLINFGAASPGAVVGEEEVKRKVDFEEAVPNGIRVVAVPNSGRPLSAPATSMSNNSARSQECSAIPPLASFSDVFRDAMKHRASACRSCSGMCNSGCYESTKEEGFIICANCFKDENFGESRSKDEFKSSDSQGVSVSSGSEWTEAETLLLLESVLSHRDDWELVAQNVETKSKLDCILKLIELPFGDSMVDSFYRTGKSKGRDGEVKKGEQLQAPEDESTETVKSDDQCVQTEITNNMQNGYSGDQEPPLKRKRVDSLQSCDSSLMKQAALISAMAGPDIAAAAAEAAVSAICNETSCPRELFDYKELFMGGAACALAIDVKPEISAVGDSSKNNELQADQDLPACKPIIPLQMRAATATTLGAAAAHAKLLADQEEREIEHLVATIIGAQMEKMQFKMKDVEDLEVIMEKEYEEIEQMKGNITSERVDVLERAINGGISRWKDHPSLKY